MRPVRASVRLWQTELFIIVIVVAILILSASLTAGLQHTLSEQGQTSQLHNATLLATQLSAQFPLTAQSTSQATAQLAEFHAIYGDSAWLYAPDGSLVGSVGVVTIPSDILTQARLQGLADSPPYTSISLKAENGYVVAGKAVYDPTGHRSGSVVVAGAPDSELAVLDAARSRLWITFWVALIVAGALGFAFSEFIGRRVRAMSKAAAAIAAGDFSQRLPVGLVPDEIRDLADSYNGMAVRLGEAFDAIHQREREITAVVESMAEGVIAFGSDGTVRVTHPLRSLGVTPVPRYYEVVRPSPVHRYFRPRGSAAWAFSLGITGKVLTFCPEAQAGVMSPLRRTPPGQSTGSRQAAPRAYPRPWFWRHRCPFDASSGIRFRSSLQPPPDGCSRLFHDAHDRGF